MPECPNGVVEGALVDSATRPLLLLLDGVIWGSVEIEWIRLSLPKTGRHFELR